MSTKILRYKTAIRRDRLSLPVKTLWNLEFFQQGRSFLDFGCGHGDDVSILREYNIQANGWDPHFFPDADISPADIVNVGYVVNVIETLQERKEVLKKAFDLSKRVLCISVMLEGQGHYSNPILFNDGYLTTRNTFQKYYSQTEFKQFVEQTLDCEAMSIAPGILFVFRTQSYEQEFLFEKQHLQRSQQNLYSLTKVRDKLKWTEHHELTQDFWNTCLHFARLPTMEEYPRYKEVQDKLGSPKKAFAYLLSLDQDDAFTQAKKVKKNNTLVFIALNCFHQRRSLSAIPAHLKRDIKALFGSYKQALVEGKELLYATGDKNNIAEAIRVAASQKLGKLQGTKFLVAQQRIHELPALLRIFIGCTSLLYGEAIDADIICLRIGSTKIDLRKYIDFEKKIPILAERVFIELANLKIDYVSYRDQKRIKRLYLKSTFMRENDPAFEKQQKFDTILERYIDAHELHSDYDPHTILKALPKSHKRKF